MEVFDAITGRRSIRKFQRKPVEHEKIGKMLDAFRWAPSAGNKQPWEIVVIDNKDKIAKLSEVSLNQHWIKGAPLVLAVCINLNSCGPQFGSRGVTLYCLQSTAAATQNMMLTAHEMGLGTCWIDPYNEREISNVIDCPKYIKPIIMLAVGYPDPFEVLPTPTRHQLTDFSHYNKFGNKEINQCKGFNKPLRHFKEKSKPFKQKLIESLKKF